MYPKWFFPLLMLSFLVLLVTGALLIPIALDTRFELNVDWRLMGDAQLAAVSTHTLMSYVMMLFIGAISTLHMRVGLKRRKNVVTGISLLVLFYSLLLTGVGLFYLGDETLTLTASAAHMTIGILISLLFVVHYLSVKVKQRVSQLEPVKS